MRLAVPLALAGVGVLALRAVRGANRPSRGPSRVIELDPIVIVGRVPAGESVPAQTPGVGGVRRPLDIRFDVRLSGVEKWGVSPAVVQQTVEANAASGILPGTGRVTVRVTDMETGYVVSMHYPDSHSDISARAAQRAIEGTDPRMVGRISNVMVSRG